MKKSITTLDLNLLLCLQLLMQERSVTKAAKRINVTPSAVSKSLAKLRAWFDDPLFVNSPLGLSPTPLMVSMEQNLAEWMQMSNLLLDKPHHQTPRGLKFELAAESPLMMIMLNALSKQIYQRYPQATIKLRNWDYDSLDAITRGEVDNGGTSNFGMSLWVLLGIIAGGFFAYIFIKDGLKNGFKDKELNKTGCMSILVAVVGLLVLVSMCSH